jgi:hypothetical protein
MSTPRHLWTLDYLAEVAKDWALSSFAMAEHDDFALVHHRFELDGHTVRRRRIPRRSQEAADPLQAIRRTCRPVAWARSDVVTLLADCDSGTVEYEQEIVEVLAVDELGEIVVEAAFVVRIPGFPPCLGSFSDATERASER